MTNNRTTELLRGGLTERGIEWTASRYSGARHAKHTKWITASGSHVKYTEYDDGQTVMVIEASDVTPEQAIAATVDRSNATSDQESIVRLFLRKISPNRDWDYLGEHEHALIADLVDEIAATLGNPEIVRCRDCRHATISTMGVCKYCEMFVLPDVDGYGADPQVNLPLDFFCGFAERKEVD